MNLILFIHKDSLQKGITLKHAIEHSYHEGNIQVCNTLDSLKERLKKNFREGHNEILIILAESVQRLNSLISLSNLMEGRRIVLILPDESKQTLSRASKFFPRFITTVKDNYDDLCDVIGKMREKTYFKRQ